MTADEPIDMFAAMRAMARGVDVIHTSGLLAERSGVQLDRALHPVLATISQHGSLRTSALAAALALKTSTVSRHVGRLEQLALVQRSADAGDGRASRIALTPQGLAVNAALRAAWERIFSEAMASATLEHPQQLTSDLTSFGQALSGLCQPPATA